ncbi:unnamed protein product [Leuciscus chuanchicus]
MKQWPSCCFLPNVPAEASSTFHKAILQAHSQRESSRNEEKPLPPSLLVSPEAYRRLDDKTTSTSSSQCVGRRAYVKFKKLGFTSAWVLVYMRYSTTKDESPFCTVHVVDAHVRIGPPGVCPPPPLGTGQGQIDRTAWGQAPLCQQPPHALPDVFNKGFHLTNSAAEHRPASFNPPRLWNKQTLKPDRKDVGNRCTDAGNDAACTAVLKDKMSNIFQFEPKKLGSCQ